jgi:hypothetical protein
LRASRRYAGDPGTAISAVLTNTEIRRRRRPRSRRAAGVGGHRPSPAGARPPRRRPSLQSGRDRLPQRLALTSLALSHRPNRLEQRGPPPRARPARAHRGTTWGTKLSAPQRTELNSEHHSELRSPRFGFRTRYRTQEVAGSSPASSISTKALLRRGVPQLTAGRRGSGADSGRATAFMPGLRAWAVRGARLPPEPATVICSRAFFRSCVAGEGEPTAPEETPPVSTSHRRT